MKGAWECAKSDQCRQRVALGAAVQKKNLATAFVLGVAGGYLWRAVVGNGLSLHQDTGYMT